MSAEYKNSCFRYAEWLLENSCMDRPFCSFPLHANTLLDIGAEFKQDFTKWVTDRLDKHLLRLLVTKSKDKKALGGFCGEDEEGDTSTFKGNTLDYVIIKNDKLLCGNFIKTFWQRKWRYF